MNFISRLVIPMDAKKIKAFDELMAGADTNTHVRELAEFKINELQFKIYELEYCIEWLKEHPEHASETVEQIYERFCIYMCENIKRGD